MTFKESQKIIIYFITALCSFSSLLMAAKSDKFGGWFLGHSLIFFVIGLAFANED